MLFVLFGTHVLACCWCYLGIIDKDLPLNQRKSWAYVNNFDYHSKAELYIYAIYWVLQTITTVGYGDYPGHTQKEYIFSMALEFIGLTFFSFMMGSINNMLKRSDTFEDLIESKLNSLDLWIKKIERSYKPFHIPPLLYCDIRQYV